MRSRSVCTDDGGCVAALLRLPLSGMRDLRQQALKTVSADLRRAILQERGDWVEDGRRRAGRLKGPGQSKSWYINV